MSDCKRRIAQLEKLLPDSCAVILLDKIDGVIYWNDQETTIEKIRETYGNAVLLIDDISAEGEFIAKWPAEEGPVKLDILTRCKCDKE